MNYVPTLWKANAIAFVSSFCVMVIELVAARILAPHIGVSLYTWTSIIGVILAGIALGNYLGGKVADRYPSPLLLALILITGGLLTIGILPAVRIVTAGNWFGNLTIMWDFVLKTSTIFFLPAILLSMVSPMVIKLTLDDLGRTGGIVGTIYACSTAGSILGTFMTGFYLISWFGTSVIIWQVGAVLILTGIFAWLLWRISGKWNFTLKNFIFWSVILYSVIIYLLLFQFRVSWQNTTPLARLQLYATESNYHTVQVVPSGENIKVLILDSAAHGYTYPSDPTHLVYSYVKVFAEIVSYITVENQAPRVLHLGGGAYSFPWYMEVVYPQSLNDVVEIDPVVTQVAYSQLGLPLETTIKTYNQDARFFLKQRKSGVGYNIVIGDVFNDISTPYHLTTHEFNNLVKANMEPDGIYVVNVIDDFKRGKYLASFVHTLRQTFNNVYLFSTGDSWNDVEASFFVIIATDRHIDLSHYVRFLTEQKSSQTLGIPYDESKLERYLAERDPVLLTDDYAPTDILLATFIRKRQTAE